MQFCACGSPGDQLFGPQASQFQPPWPGRHTACRSSSGGRGWVELQVARHGCRAGGSAHAPHVPLPLHVPLLFLQGVPAGCGEMISPLSGRHGELVQHSISFTTGHGPQPFCCADKPPLENIPALQAEQLGPPKPALQAASKPRECVSGWRLQCRAADGIPSLRSPLHRPAPRVLLKPPRHGWQRVALPPAEKVPAATLSVCAADGACNWACNWQQQPQQQLAALTCGTEPAAPRFTCNRSSATTLSRLNWICCQRRAQHRAGEQEHREKHASSHCCARLARSGTTALSEMKQ